MFHFAVEKKHWISLSFVEFLVDYGADPTITNDKGQTVIHWIINQSTYSLTVLLTNPWINFLLTKIHIQNNNTTNFTHVYGLSHFHAACMINGIEIVEFFLNNGVSIDEAVNMDSPKYAGRTPLYFAAEYGYTELVDRLLSRGAKLTKASDGMTPLHMLVKRNMAIIQYINFRRFLAGEHSEVNSYPIDKEKLLAEMGTNEKIIRSILSKTDESMIDNVGLFPFYLMCTIDDTAMNWTQNDINRHISGDSAFWPEYTALHFAACFDVDTVKLLLKKGADIEAKDVNGFTPFDICVGRYSVEDIHLIVSSHSIWRNVLLSDGKTKLLDLVYAMRNREEFVKFLSGMQEDINGISIPNHSPLWPGYTILHLVLTLSKKGMRFRAASSAPLFDDYFKMKESGNPYTLRYLSFEYSEEQLTRRPNEMLEVCLSSGAKVTAQDHNGLTPVHLAFRRMDLENLYFLLKRCEGQWNPTDQDNLSLLHIACAVEDVDLVKNLIAYGADVNGAIKSSFQWDPDVRQFYDLGSDKRLHVWVGSTPLHVAMTTNSKEIVRLLMEAGANLNARDVDGMTPLHWLIARWPRKSKQQGSIVDDAFLVRFISEDCVVDGLSYLHIAAHREYPKGMEKLISLGANVNSPIVARDCAITDLSFNNYNMALNRGTTKLAYYFNYFGGNTPLHMVYEFDRYDLDAAKILISRGADVLANNSRGISTIVKMLKDVRDSRLLEHYASAMSEDDEKRLIEVTGLTRLHLACHLRDEKMIRDCLKKGANVNARVPNDSVIWPGFTPLHVLVKVEDRVEKDICQAVRLLLNHGADVMITNAKGETPLLLGFFNNHAMKRPRHIDLLWKKLKNSVVNPTSDEGISHFHLACIRNDAAMVERFLKMGVDANQTVDYYSKVYPGYTPLHFAVSHIRYGYFWLDLPVLKTINLLLEHGANVNAMTVDNMTPLHLAGDYPSLCALPYKRLFWAGADPEFRTLTYDKAPRCRLFNVESGEVRSKCYSLSKAVVNQPIRSVVRGSMRSLYRAYYQVRNWSAKASAGMSTNSAAL